jgi:phosphotransferase system HPr (HPr) family protein
MEQEYIIQNLLGIHVKPAKHIVQLASKYECDIVLVKDGKRANAKRLIEVLTLGAKGNETVTLVTTGPQEAEAQREIGQVLSQAIEPIGK